MKRLAALLIPATLAALGGDLRQVAFDLDQLPEGGPPREIFVIDGSIQIKSRQGRKVIEISGSKPEIDAGAVLGASASGAAEIEARAFATKAGRSFPRFGVGVHGQTGFRLFVVPARKQLHLMKGDEVIKTVPFDWTSGSHVKLRLSVRPAGGGKWTVTGKAWPAENHEPQEAQLTHETTGPAAHGQCSIWGTPYAGTPVDFDEIKVGTEG